MASVAQFSQYLLKNDPQRSPPRQTLFNFLKTFLEPEAPFTASIIQAFYARVLQFDHWQTESQQLTQVIKNDCVDFLRLHESESSTDATQWGHLRHPDTLQVVQLKMFKDLEDLVLSEHKSRQKSGDSIKTIRISDQQILVAILSPDGPLEVKVYPNLALVWGSRLRLAAPVTQLHYGSDFELAPHVKQILEGSLMTTHCFHLDVDGTHGVITRGFTFQKFETFIRAPIHETQDLFTSLKRLERHYIDSQSDSYYQELVGKLERANRLLNNPTRENLILAEKALNRGRLGLKTAFPNDRLLTLLLTHLEYGISQRKTPDLKDEATPRNLYR